MDAQQYFLEKWSRPILNTLEAISETGIGTTPVTSNVDGLVAQFLFEAGLTNSCVREGLEAYCRDKSFDGFYTKFKETELYRTMVEIRESQKDS